MEGFDTTATCHNVQLEALSGMKIFQRAEWYLQGRVTDAPGATCEYSSGVGMSEGASTSQPRR